MERRDLEATANAELQILNPEELSDFILASCLVR